LAEPIPEYAKKTWRVAASPMQYSGEVTAARRETHPMAEGPLQPVIRRIRRLVGDEDLAATGDGPLLARFAADRDEAAFAELIQRHGPMVLGVCRRFLPDPSAAEDAFQATFLVLVKKAGAVGRGERLAGWLYGVAGRSTGGRRNTSVTSRSDR
jgi:hypothetical protein